MVRKKSKPRASASSVQVTDSTTNSSTLNDETLAQTNAHLRSSSSPLASLPRSLSPLSIRILLVVLMVVLVVLFSLLSNSEITSSLRSNSNSISLGASLFHSTIDSTGDHTDMKGGRDHTTFSESPKEIVSYDDDGSDSMIGLLTFGATEGFATGGAVERTMSGVTIHNPINEGLCSGESMEKYRKIDTDKNNNSTFWFPRVLASYSTSATSTTTSGGGQLSSHTVFLPLAYHHAGGGSGVTAFSVPTNDFYASTAAMAGGIRKEQMHWRPSKCPNDAHWMIPWAVERGREARMVAGEINRLVKTVMFLLSSQKQTRRKGVGTFYSHIYSKIGRCFESSRQHRLDDERPHFLCHKNNIKFVRNAIYRTMVATTTSVDSLHPLFKPTSTSTRSSSRRREQIGVVGLSLPFHIPSLLNRLVRLLGWRIVDVGANKGYTVASFIDLLLTPRTELDAESIMGVDLSDRGGDGNGSEGGNDACRGKRRSRNKERFVSGLGRHGNDHSITGTLRSALTGVDFDTLTHLLTPPPATTTKEETFGSNITKEAKERGKEESTCSADEVNGNNCDVHDSVREGATFGGAVVEGSSVGNVGVVWKTSDAWRASDFYELYGKTNGKNRLSHETKRERQRHLGDDDKEDPPRSGDSPVFANARVKKVVASGTHPYGPLWLGAELFQRFHIDSHNQKKEEASNPANINNNKKGISSSSSLLLNPNSLCGGCCECVGNYNSAGAAAASSHSAQGQSQRGSSDHEQVVEKDVFKSLRAAFKAASASEERRGSSTGGRGRVYGRRERDVLCLRPALLTKWAWLKHSPEKWLTMRKYFGQKQGQHQSHHHDDNDHGKLPVNRKDTNPTSDAQLNKDGQQDLIGTKAVVSLISEFVYVSMLFMLKKSKEQDSTFSVEDLSASVSATYELNFICEGGHDGDENGVAETESLDSEIRIGGKKVVPSFGSKSDDQKQKESGDSLFALFKPAFVTIHAFEPSYANFKWLTHYFRSPSSLHLKSRKRQRDEETQFDDPNKKFYRRLAPNYLFQDRRGGLELYIFRKAVGSRDSHHEIDDGELNDDDNNDRAPSGIFEGEVPPTSGQLGVKNTNHSTENSINTRGALNFIYGDILSQFDERLGIRGLTAHSSCDERKETETSFTEVFYQSSVSSENFEEKGHASQRGTTENVQRRRKSSSARPTKRRYVWFPDVELGSEVGAIASASSSSAKSGEEESNGHEASQINPNLKPRLSPVELTSLDEHFLQNLLGLDLDSEREEALLSSTSTQREEDSAITGAAEENNNGAENDEKMSITFDGVIKSTFPIHSTDNKTDTRDDSERAEPSQNRNLGTNNERRQVVVKDGSPIHFFNPFLSPYAIDKKSMYSVITIGTINDIINHAAGENNSSNNSHSSACNDGEGATLCIGNNKASLHINDEEKASGQSSSSFNLFSSSLPLIDHLVTDAQGHDVEVFNGASLLFSRGDIASYQLELGRQANYYDIFVKNLGQRRKRVKKRRNERRRREGSSRDHHLLNDVEKVSFGNNGAFTYACYFPTESKKGQSVPTHVRINHGNARHAATASAEDNGKFSRRHRLRGRERRSDGSSHNCWKKWYESASGWINVFCVKREERLDLSSSSQKAIDDSFLGRLSSHHITGSADPSKQVVEDSDGDVNDDAKSSRARQISSLLPPPPSLRLSNTTLKLFSRSKDKGAKMRIYFGLQGGKSSAFSSSSSSSSASVVLPLTQGVDHLSHHSPASLSDIMDHIEKSMAHRKAAGFCPSNALQQRIIAHMLKSTQQQQQQQ